MLTCRTGCRQQRPTHSAVGQTSVGCKTCSVDAPHQLQIRPARLYTAPRTRRIRRPTQSAVRKLAWATHEVDRDVEKEASRPYKRTVFNFKNWAAHRSSKRYARHMRSLLRSRIVRGLFGPLLAVTSISTVIALYETLLEAGYLPLGAPGLTIEATAHLSLTSFALSLLLVFRTNSSYARWQEARGIWGGITNRSRDIVQQALTFIPGEEPELVDMFKRWGIAYSKTLMCHLTDDHDIKLELQGVLRPHELGILLATHHKPNYILQVLRGLVASTCIASRERIRMDQNITFFMDAQGACERILKTPIPLSYTRHTSRFMVIWLALMPFTLWKTCHWAIIPVSAVIAFLLLGIEEIGVQIEEPFGILPLEAMCNTIEADLTEMVHNDFTVRQLTGSMSERNAKQSHLSHDDKQALAKAQAAQNKSDDFLRASSSNGSGWDKSFATPDIPNAEQT